MNMRTKLMVVALATLPFTGSLAAQEAKPFDAGLSWSLATDNLKEITNTSGAFAGFNLDIGYNTKLAGTSVPLRLSFGVNDFPGKDNAGEKRSLLGYQLAGDIFVNSGLKDLSFVTGLSINKWTSKISPEPVGYSSNVKGIKFGLRLGAEYQINPNWSAAALLQVVELGTDLNATKGFNPSWVQLGVKYHF
jgi:hypothetical protein